MAEALTHATNIAWCVLNTAIQEGAPYSELEACANSLSLALLNERKGGIEALLAEIEIKRYYIDELEKSFSKCMKSTR